MTFSRYFKPGVVVRCTSFGVELLTITSTGLVPRNNPHVTFAAKKSLTPTPDTATIELYNLGEARRKVLSSTISELEYFEVEVLCGYDGQLMRLFRGRTRNFRERDRRGGDLVTTIVADDSGDEITEVQLRFSGKLLTAGQMVDLALASFAQLGGIPIAKHPSVDQVLATVPPTGFTVVSVGKASDLLTEVARITKSRWFIRDGLLYFVQRNQPVDPVAYVLPSTHWLAPPSQDGSGLLRVATFCDPMIQPGGQVQLLPDGSASPYQLTPPRTDVAGFYRVEAAEYSGDTEATSPWAANLTVRSLR